MKTTKKEIQKIIKEELESYLQEQEDDYSSSDLEHRAFVEGKLVDFMMDWPELAHIVVDVCREITDDPVPALERAGFKDWQIRDWAGLKR